MFLLMNRNAVCFLCISIFSFLYCLYANTPYSIGDAKLHIYFGNYFRDHNFEIPSVCIGSWYGEEQNLSWIAHEWLSEVLMSYISPIMENIFSHTSYMQVFSILACLILMGYFVVFHQKRYNILNVEDGKGKFFGFFFFLFIIVYSLTPHIGFKPSFFGYVCFLLEMGIMLDSHFAKKTLSFKHIFFIFLLSTLWSNFHGGSSILSYAIPFGFFLLSILCSINRFYEPFSSFFPIVVDKEILEKNKFRYVIAFFLAVVGVTINPYGIHMLTYPFNNMMDYGLMLQYINEWHPFDITDKTHLLALLPILFVMFIFYICNTKRKEIKFNLVELSFLSFFFLMSMKSVRFSIYFVLFSAFLYHPSMFPSTSCQIKSQIEYDWKKYACKMGCLAVAVLSFMTVSFGWFSIDKTPLEGNKRLREIIMKEQPQRIFQWLIGGNELLTDYGIQPFIDGRADIYATKTYPDAERLLFLKEEPEKIIEKYKFDYLLLNVSPAMTWYYKKYPEKYQILYQDEMVSFIKIKK